MSEVKFTQGEWVAGRKDMATIESGHESKWVYCDNKYIAMAYGEYCANWDETYANAELISAAPDMYRAASALILALSPYWDNELCDADDVNDAAIHLLAALAKARGEQ